MKTIRAGVAWLGLAIGVALPAHAQDSRLDYRVIFASHRQLARQIEAAGKDGYHCVAVARGDADTSLPGVAVVLGRAVEGTTPPVAHRVVTAAGSGVDLSKGLDAAGAEGFRLCGVVLDEEAPAPTLVAVLSRTAGAAPPPVHFGVELLTNYKNSMVRLEDGARNGLVPVAATAVNNNRVPAMRSWLVVTEGSGHEPAPREIAVRSASGPDRLQRALNEQSAQGYRIDVVWKEGNDVVAMMSRALGDAKHSTTYAADVAELGKVHSLSHLYVADFPYLSGHDRIVISDGGVKGSADIEQDPLPPLGPLGYADPNALARLGDHISRHHGFAPASVRIGRAPNGGLTLTTVLTSRD